MRREAVFLVCCYLASCSSGSMSNPPPDPPRDFSANTSLDLSAVDLSMPDLSGPSATQACGDWAMASCMKSQMCAPAYVQIYYGDLATCVARRQADCMSNYFTAPGTSLTTARWEACGQAISMETCDQNYSFTPPTDCRAQPGSRPNGAACLYDNQCQSARCKKDYGLPCGTCAVIQPLGGACATYRDCADGQDCSTSNICIAIVGAGATCDATHACDGAYRCRSNSCVAAAPVDGACTTNDDCAAYLTCVSNKCKAGSFAAPGAPCGYLAANTAWVYCTKGTCKLDSSGQQGTCVAEAADGAACDPAMAQYCVLPAECTATMCKILDPMSCM